MAQAPANNHGAFSFLTTEELLRTTPSAKDKDAFIDELKSRLETYEDFKNKLEAWVMP